MTLEILTLETSTDMEKQYCTECGAESHVLITDYRHNVNGQMMVVIKNDEHLCGNCAGRRKYYKDLTTMNQDMLKKCLNEMKPGSVLITPPNFEVTIK